MILTDFYNISAQLDDEERLVQKTVADFVDDSVLPIIAEAFDNGVFPRELIKEIAELGLFGSSIDGYDCAGLNSICYGLICQELERGDSGLRSLVSVQSSLVMWPIFQFGSELQKQTWIPRLAKGEALGCFGLTESQGGSDPNAMTTFAKRDGDDWIINGSKMWITNGSVADIALVWAQTDQGIQGFLLDSTLKGFSANDIPHKFSLRASITSELVFDNVRVSSAACLPNAIGLKYPLACLTQARYGIAWGAIGAATACFVEVVDYTKSRKLFGRSMAATQTVQRRLANMLRGITTAQVLALQLGRLKDQNMMKPSQVSLAKWNNVRMALDIARDARDLLGGNGITVDFCAIRHMLNLESVITYEGTETIHELAVGREITGIAAF